MRSSWRDILVQLIMHTRRIIRAINIYHVVFFCLVGWRVGGKNRQTNRVSSCRRARYLYVVILCFISKKNKQQRVHDWVANLLFKAPLANVFLSKNSCLCSSGALRMAYFCFLLVAGTAAALTKCIMGAYNWDVLAAVASGLMLLNPSSARDFGVQSKSMRFGMQPLFLIALYTVT